jgi:7-keto-8-aminopelargonate synthetase-like enzyme
VLVVIDGVYSMHGDIADLPGALACAHAHGARLLLDDAHGLGVLGASGAGTAEHFGVVEETDLVMVSFSKSLASIGGAIAGPADVIEYIKHAARSMIFSAALPASATAAALAALEVMQREPGRRDVLWQRRALLVDGLRAAGFDVGGSQTPIVPVMVRSRMALGAFWQALFKAGIFVSAIIPPAVPEGHEMLRMSVSAAHSAEALERVVATCAEAGRATGVIS